MGRNYNTQNASTAASVAILTICFGLTSALAHDLRGLDQHYRYKKSSLMPGETTTKEQSENFRTLRELAKAAPTPGFDIAMHLAARGFAGSSANVAFGVAKKTARWPDGYQLSICFFDGPAVAQANVMALYSEILAFTTLSALNVGKCGGTIKGNVRVSFATGEGYWSFVGMEAQTQPQSVPTMGLDGLGLNGPLDDAGKGVVRHEILHSVGFEHEHQRPDIDCRFKPFKDIAKLMGWTENQVKTNFERMKASPNLLLTSFDANSEMLYQLDAPFFAEANSPCMISQANNKLSPVDISTLKLLYPQPGTPLTVQMLLSN